MAITVEIQCFADNLYDTCRVNRRSPEASSFFGAMFSSRWADSSVNGSDVAVIKAGRRPQLERFRWRNAELVA